MQSNLFISKLFRSYYATDTHNIIAPSMIDKREFGFVSFDGVMVRHKSFVSKDELLNFLKAFTPSDVYYSCAYYEAPWTDMERKGWLGADLIFDIDADHIPTPCDKVHDQWTCGACGFSGKGVTPEKCPICGKEKFETSIWPCEVCLESAKNETIKLLDILMRDFVFSDKDIGLFFSGHRGYHIHIESEIIRELDAVARKELVDYCSGLGLDLSLHGLNGKASLLNKFGWSKRLAHRLHEFFLKADENDFKRIGLKKNTVEAIMRNKFSILKSLNVGTLGGVRGIGYATWKKIMEHAVKLESIYIDTVVTTDVHRLIRLVGTLHGKTGFKKIGFPASAIDSFDPFKDGVAFKGGAVKVFVFDAPAFRIGDEVFGPIKNREVELPTAAAALLLCKRRAELIG